MPTAAQTFSTPDESTGARLMSVDGRALPLLGASLTADARGGLVRVTLEQTFRNPYAEPLKVRYSLPLPADGAVSGFSFRVGEELVVGEVDLKHKARERFENALLEGRTAAILDQERSSLFTQEVGNVPPRAEVRCQVQVDQKAAWLPDGCWEWRFPTVVAPRYLGGPGRVADAAKVTVDVADQALPVKLSLGLTIRDQLAEGARPESVSHALHSERGLGRVEVSLADERGASLDRDVVVRWKVAGAAPRTSLDVVERNGRLFGLLTLTPPAPEAKMAPVPRDLIVLLDTSGSMGGSPLDQARRLTHALVDSLGDADQLELIEFSNSPRRWKRGPVAATASNRRDAQAWLARLSASGGTEMRTGILEALAPLRPDAQRQIILITDGQIGFESEIVQTVACSLPKGSRVHTIGVGSGVNRSLTQPTARAGRGVELICGLGEDVERQVARLLERTNAPLVTNVEVSGTAVKAVAPARVPDLYGGAPALISVELDPRGGSMVVSGHTAQGGFEEQLRVGTPERSGTPAIAALFAREQVEDLELSLAAGGTKSDVDAQIERLGVGFQISTRLTSWVAVSAKQTVDPRAPRREETMPHELPFGVSAEGVGLRPAVAGGAPRGRALRSAVAAGAMTKMFDQAPPSFARSEEAPLEPEPEFEAAESDDFAMGPPPAAPAPQQQVHEAKRKAEISRGQAESPPKAGGLRGLVKDVFERLTEKSDDATRSSTPPSKPAPAKRPGATEADVTRAGAVPAPAFRLKARLVKAADGQTVLDVTLDSPLQWAPDGAAFVLLPDGQRTLVRVLTEKSTAPGQYDAALHLTVVLEGAFPNASAVQVLCGGQLIELAW